MKKSERAAVLLMAEDNPGDQKITQKALERAKIRNKLYIVQDGEEALDYLFHRGAYSDPEKSPTPDLFLLDLNMPKVDGREVLEEIKDVKKLSNMRIVVLTTSQQEEDILRSYDLGVHSYIVKPVNLERFMEVISKLSEYWLDIVVLPPG